MKNVLLQQAIKLTKQYRRRKHWQQFVRITAAAVVFVTTYALVLPAITMEKETLCGQQEHTHTEECYTDKTVWLMHCTLKADKDIVVLHTHQDHCYTAEGALICQIVERSGHTHDDSCYGAPECICQIPEGEGHTHSESCTTGKVLTCELPESPGHTHNDTCAVTEQVLICGTQETPGHSHSESCITTVTEMTCTEAHEHTEQCSVVTEVPCALEETEGHTHGEGCYETRTVPCAQAESQGHSHTEACYGTGTVECKIPETPAHTHGKSCYGQRGPLVCELEEQKPHAHDERCYDSKGNMTCTLPVTVAHTHDETCVTDTGKKVSVLTCDKKVHLHSDDCFAVEEEIQLAFLCDTGAHSHGESCYDGENVLTCTIPEHTHEAACVVADLDLTADVETPEQWEAPLKELYRTGRWPEDLLAVAKTQLEYQESVKNCVLTDMQLKGYTRYGAWYGTPYGDWNTLFVSFCLDYARVEDFPVHEDRVRWMELLEEEELLRIPADYTPKPGDLVFLDQDQVADAPVEIPVIADLVGIVEEILPAAEEEPIRLKFIAGDVNNKVDYVTCPLDDITIVGYAELPPEAEKETAEQDARQLTYEGEDYTVTVTFTAEAQLPENVQLDVREILAGTEEYDQYYQQSVAMIQGDTQQPEAVAEEESTDSDLPQETESVIEELIEKIIEQEPEETAEEASEEEQKPEVTFARFFDIHFVSDGTVLEPAAPVDIHIQYHQGIVQQDQRKGVAVHFAETGAEILNAETVWNQNSQVESFSFTQNSFSVSGTVLVAEPRAAGDCYVWIDGTCGNLKLYTDAEDYRVIVKSGEYLTLPEHDSLKSPSTYNFRLKGWYDIRSGEHYDPGESVMITQNTVFYADWIADTYNIGDYVPEMVETLDTNEFITVDVFDYNVLFNADSARLDYTTTSSANRSSLDDDGHTEKWLYNGTNTLDFIFADANGEDTGTLAEPSGRNSKNTYTGGDTIFSGIMPADLNAPNEDLELIDTLFNKNQQKVLGRHYLGGGNYLFQYDNNPTSDNYGYYYYDSELNAASYYQDAERFYVYNYLEHSSTSKGKDFLPLNSPYANNPSGKGPTGSAAEGYVYDTTANRNNRTVDNFFFGMKTNIHFYLPNDVGVPVDNHGNPGNLDTNGKPMVFKFSGDDDVWIYVDGVLVLDIGGIHQKNGGSINFSTGEVVLDGRNLTTTQYGDDYLAHLFSSYGGLKEGGHNLTIYYLERGCGESNCSIYFNLAPRYGLTLTKQDYHTQENLADVTFGVYLDQGLSQEAMLWPTHEAAKADPNHNNTENEYTTDENGYLSFFGLVAGKTYYIKELSNPNEGYSLTDDLIRVTLNNHGVDISEVTMIGGSNGRTQGYELISHHLDEVNQVVKLVLTNQKNIDPDQKTKDIRVVKKWTLSQEDPAEIPDSVTVFLTRNDEQYGPTIQLGPHNGWTYTWTGIPDDGSKYEIYENPVSGFASNQTVIGNSQTEQTVHWLTVGALEDSAGYRLKVGNNFLKRNSGQMTLVSSPGDDEAAADTLWRVEAEAEGFRVSNGDYAITLVNGSFTLRPIGEGNQVLYYDGDGLFAMQNGNLHYLSASGTSVSTDSAVYPVELQKREEISTDVYNIQLTNTQLKNEETTFLDVTKVWNTNGIYWDRKITMHLYRNDVDTGYAIVLDKNSEKENGNWGGTFEGLPLKDEAGNTYRYSVVEGPVDGYQPDYSEVTQVPGTTEIKWQPVDSLADGKTYVFASSDSRALSISSGYFGNTNLSVSTLSDSQKPSTSQQWVLESRGNDYILKNASKDVYLRYSSGFTVTSSSSDATAVSLSDHKLSVRSSNKTYYLVLNSYGVDDTRNGGTTLTVYQQNTVTTADGYAVTVTNSPFIYYILPETGGSGTWLYTLLGFALAAIAVVVFSSGKKGGRYAR